MIRLKLSLLLLIFSCHGAFAQWNSIGPSVSNGQYDHDIAFNPQTKQLYMAYVNTQGEKISVVRFENGSWVTVGSNISDAFADNPHIEITANGTIYVAFTDGTANKVTVMYKTSTSSTWNTYGSADFTPGVTSIDFHAEDLASTNTTGNSHLFLAYKDNQNHIAVMANDVSCTCWGMLSSEVLTSNNSIAYSRITMAVHNNKVSIAYTIDENTSEPLVNIKQMDLTNIQSNWGSPILSESGYYPDVSVDPSNQRLTAAWTRYGGIYTTRNMMVSQYDGSQWSFMGSSGLGQNSGVNELNFNPITGVAHVLFVDANQSYKTSVMKFDGSSWSFLGQAGFGSSMSYATHLSFNPQSSLPYVSSALGNNTITVHSFYDGCSRTLANEQEQITSSINAANSYQFEIFDPVAQVSQLITASGSNNYITAANIPNYVEGRTYHIRSRGYYTMFGGYSQWSDYCYITMPISEETGGNPNGGFGGGFNGGDRISLYPNPSSGTLTLGLSGQVESAEEVKLNIFSSTGQLIRSIDPSFAETDITTKLDLNDLAPGMYMISGFVSQKAVSKTFIME